MNTDNLIDRLARTASPAPPLSAPAARTSMWLLWSALYLAGVGLRLLVAASKGGMMLTPLYLAEQVAALTTGLTAARAALGSVVPGEQDWHVRLLPVVSAGVWVALLLFETMRNVNAVGTLGVTGQTDWPCVASMTLGGIVLGAPLVWMLRRGAPITPRTTALWAGLAAASVASIEACLTRPHAFAAIVLLWHGGTILAIALLAAATARRWLPWPSLGTSSFRN